MRLTREKVNLLSHQIAERLATIDAAFGQHEQDSGQIGIGGVADFHVLIMPR